MIDVVVVVYNQRIDLDTLNNVCQAFCDMGVRIIYCDNTTDCDILKHNKSLIFGDNVYIPMGGNVGLAKAYNTAIESNVTDVSEWVLLLDQDTIVTDSYLKEARNCLCDKKLTAKILIPQIKAIDRYISPTNINGHVVSYKKKANSKITAINSGLIINREVFEIIGRYDERYFLDYIDHDFFRRCNKLNIPMLEMQSKLIQNFSGLAYKSKSASLAPARMRFLIFKRDFKIFCSDTFRGKIYYYLKIAKRTVALTIRYKSLSFIATGLRSVGKIN